MHYFRHTYTHNIFALNPPLEHSVSKSNDVRTPKQAISSTQNKWELRVNGNSE